MRGDGWAIVALIFFAALAGAGINQMWMKGEVVEHGCAHYDSQTGEWEWNSE